MMYVYRRPYSESAELLAEVLDGRYIQRFGRLSNRLKNDDVIICWGECVQHKPGQILNGHIPLRSKFTDITILTRAGVPTVEVATRARDGWLPRETAHENGNDLLHPPAQPAFWVKKENIVREYRVHSFDGRSIRAGVKQKTRANAHPWIRSTAAGWIDTYNGVTQPIRDISHRAVEALGLTFGAVDVGEKADGSLLVLEVNRAPGLNRYLADAYTTAIQRWVGGQHGR